MRMTDSKIAEHMRWWAYLARIARNQAGPKTIKRGWDGKRNQDQENARRARQVMAGTLQMHRTLI
jgi:hypothetical protein